MWSSHPGIFLQFHIKAAGSSLGGVTAVSFFDGEKNTFADMPIIGGNYPLVINKKEGGTSSTTNGVNIINKGTSKDDESEETRGFGFQLYPSKHDYR